MYIAYIFMCYGGGDRMVKSCVGGWWCNYGRVERIKKRKYIMYKAFFPVELSGASEEKQKNGKTQTICLPCQGKFAFSITAIKSDRINFKCDFSFYRNVCMDILRIDHDSSQCGLDSQYRKYIL